MRPVILYLLILNGFSSCLDRQVMTRPNVVFILVDDLGWKDLGFMGSDFYETPNLDDFSKHSLVFTNAYASGSVCSPSRAAIMTGKHPARLQITDWIPGQGSKNNKLNTPPILNELPLEEITLAERLQSNGYKTFFAGKWHLGNQGFFPEDQGFNINKGGHDKGSPPGGYYTPYKNPKLADGPEGEYLTDRLTEESMQFLDGLDKEPFLLYLSFYTVHTPIQANKAYVRRFTDKLVGLEVKTLGIREERLGVTRLFQRNPEYASMVYAMDVNVGRLLEKLKELDLYDNTIIVFTSDNGGLSTLHKNRSNLAPTSVMPLRGGKGWLYEGGIRVPLLFKPVDYQEGERVIETPVIGHDFYPTLAAQLGLKLEPDYFTDGLDLSPLLKGEVLNDRKLIWHYPHYHGSGWTPGSAIRQGKWKLIEFNETNEVELYNLEDDLSETNDLSLAMPEMTAKLKKALHQTLKGMNASGVEVN